MRHRCLIMHECILVSHWNLWYKRTVQRLLCTWRLDPSSTLLLRLPSLIARADGLHGRCALLLQRGTTTRPHRLCSHGGRSRIGVSFRYVVPVFSVATRAETMSTDCFPPRGLEKSFTTSCYGSTGSNADERPVGSPLRLRFFFRTSITRRHRKVASTCRSHRCLSSRTSRRRNREFAVRSANSRTHVQMGLIPTC